MKDKLALLAIHRNPKSKQNKTIRVVRELEAAEESALHASNEYLGEFQTWDALMRIVEMNARSMEEAFNSAAQEAAGRALRGQLGSLIDLTVNRAVINLITSFKLYLDHTNTRLQRRFGNESDALKLYKKTTSAAFDTSFAYRFIGQLRDYSVHCGLPVSRATVTGQVMADDNTEHTFSCEFDPQHLLSTGPSYWRGKVKADLMNADSPFAVKPILDEAVGQLAAIHAKLIDYEKPHLHASARVILDLVGEVFAPDVIPAIGSVIHQTSSMTVTFVDLPAQMMARLGYWKLEA